MAFCIVAESEAKIDWDITHTFERECVAYFDLFPIIALRYHGIGISVIKSNMDLGTFKVLKELILKLLANNFRIFELYNGQEVTFSNVDGLKEYF